MGHEHLPSLLLDRIHCPSGDQPDGAAARCCHNIDNGPQANGLIAYPPLEVDRA